MPLLKRKPEPQEQYSATAAVSQDNSETKRSNNVGAKRSKNVPARVRRSTSKDAKILNKIKAFGDWLAAAQRVSSSVAPSPPLPTPLPTPSNDNNIPVWALTGDRVKLVAATGALMIAERPAIAFTFNLTPEAIALAQADPAGFLDSLKRRWDEQLRKAFGAPFRYCFGIDITREGRLHIHGAFEPPATSVRTERKLKDTMRDAWGDWKGPGKKYQIDFQPLRDDGWVEYFMRNRPRVGRTVKGRTFTINHPLRRDAESTYGEIRNIMRDSNGGGRRE